MQQHLIKLVSVSGLKFAKRFIKLQPQAASIVITGDAKGTLRHCEFNGETSPPFGKTLAASRIISNGGAGISDWP